MSQPAETRDRPTPAQWLTRLAPYAFWGADLDFVRHRARNAEDLPEVPSDLDGPLRQRLLDARALALSGGNALGRRLRVYLPIGLGLLGCLGLLATLVHAAAYWGERSWLLLLLPIGISQGVAGVGFWVYQGLLRESVVRHEVRQVLVTLVGEGVLEADASPYQRRLALAWRLRRGQDAALTLASLGLPLLGVGLFPLAFLRSAGSLAQHELHEESLQREVELARGRDA